jgi:hypothetical protein
MEDRLIPFFMPPLVALLARAEELKADPLTEEEVLRIRDNANCMMVPADVVRKTEQDRGYPDIDPEDCWEEWQRVRAELADNQDAEP